MTSRRHPRAVNAMTSMLNHRLCVLSLRTTAICLSLLALGMVSGCKDTEDYLTDLNTSHGPEGKMNEAVFDAPQLVHEALTGILGQEVITLAQMGRAVHSAGRILEKNESALLRADAVSLLASLTLRYPIPALSEPFKESKQVQKDALDALDALDQALSPLETETLLTGLDSPDRTVKEKARDELKKLTGQDFGLDSTPWQNWWNINREATLGKAQNDAREPLRTLGSLEYKLLPSSRAFLGYLATRLRLHELPALREEMEWAVLRLARLTVVYGIRRALRDDSPIVRSEAARAAVEVLDPEFGAAVGKQYQAELDPMVKVQLLKALRKYPARLSLRLSLLALDDREPAVAYTARENLVSLSGKDLGDKAYDWRQWWQREGKNRWP